MKNVKTQKSRLSYSSEDKVVLNDKNLINDKKDILEVSSLTKIFKNSRGIKNINFSISPGDFLVLIGPNGSGKTTLIRSILRLYQEYDGEIKIFGVNNSDPLSLSQVSYIGESAIFPRHISMKNYLFWVGKLSGLESSKIRARVRQLTATFKMESFLQLRPHSFSSGEKQKVMLIKSILEDAKLIIMDEPTANLDPEARMVFFDEIKKLNESGKSVMVCSHNLEELENKATHVLMISHGEQKYFDSKKKNQTIFEIFHNHK